MSKKALPLLNAIALLLSSMGARAVDNYAHAQFNTLAPSQCVSINDMISQFNGLQPNGFYPPGQRLYAIRHMGEPGTAELHDQIGNVVTWNAGVYTGISPFPAAAYQRGYLNDPVLGTNTFQAFCHSQGFMINTFHFNHASGAIEGPPGFPTCEGGPQASLQDTLAAPVPIFVSPSSELTLQALIELKWRHWNSNPAVGQINLYAYLQDQTTGTLFAWLPQVWDSRPFGTGNGNPLFKTDGVTWFASGPLASNFANGNPNTYITKSPYSSSMINQNTFSKRFFRAHMKPAFMAWAAAEINRRDPSANVSTDPANWYLHTIGSSAEVSWNGDPSNEIVMGGHWSYVEAFEAYEPTMRSSKTTSRFSILPGTQLLPRPRDLKTAQLPAPILSGRPISKDCLR